MSNTVFERWVEPLADVIGFGRTRGWVTVDELDAALTMPATTPGLVEDLLAALTGLGIAVLDRPGGVALIRASRHAPPDAA